MDHYYILVDTIKHHPFDIYFFQLYLKIWMDALLIHIMYIVLMLRCIHLTDWCSLYVRTNQNSSWYKNWWLICSDITFSIKLKKNMSRYLGPSPTHNGYICLQLLKTDKYLLPCISHFMSLNNGLCLQMVCAIETHFI